MINHRARPVLCCLLVLAACSATPMRVVVLFQDVNGLAVGDPVRVGKTHVGQVLALEATDHEQVAVQVRIDSPYRDRVTEDAGFTVERASLLGGGRYLAIEPGVGPVAKEGARLQGRESLWNQMAGWAKGVGAWLTDPSLRNKLQEFARSVAQRAEQGQEAFEKARPALEEQAKELVKLAEKQGPEIADKVKDLVEGLLAQKRP